VGWRVASAKGRAGKRSTAVMVRHRGQIPKHCGKLLQKTVASRLASPTIRRRAVAAAAGAFLQPLLDLEPARIHFPIIAPHRNRQGYLNTTVVTRIGIESKTLASITAEEIAPTSCPAG